MLNNLYRSRFKDIYIYFSSLPINITFASVKVSEKISFGCQTLLQYLVFLTPAHGILTKLIWSTIANIHICRCVSIIPAAIAKNSFRKLQTPANTDDHK